MATAKKSTELAPVENFALTTAYDGLDPELAAELKDQMDDLDDESGINCRTIKIPSGGSLAFTVQGDEDGDEDYPKEIEGVIVFTHRMNGYWPNAFGSSTNPEDKIPVCSSMDGKSGLNIRTGEICECDKCPCNQYGSDPNGGKGKACKNMRRIYLMRSNELPKHHFKTSTSILFSPSITYFVISNSEILCDICEKPTNCPFTYK